jgi:hypothetical protein
MGRFQPALLGGLFIGVMSALPVIGVANACCCLWVIVGGVLTTYLQQQATPAPIETSSAALSGLIAGAVGGFVNGVLGMLMFRIVGGDAQQAIEQALSNIPNMPPETADWVRGMTQGPGLALVGMLVTIPVYAVFGLLGGLLGVAFFRKKVTPEPPMAQMGPMGPMGTSGPSV